MSKPKTTTNYLERSLKIFSFVALLYIVLIILLPAHNETIHTYGLSESTFKIILTSIAIPTILVWLAAFVSYAKLEDYSWAIRKSKEGKYFANLSRGTKWLAWSLPVPSLVSLIFISLANSSSSFFVSSIIITNYISVILAVIAFSFISYATNGLATYADIKYGIVSSRLITLIFVTIGVLYCGLTFMRFDIHYFWSTNNNFFIPAWLLIFTLVIPYLYSWFVGLLAAYEISLFSHKTKGIVYKEALTYLASGLVAVIVGLIAQQFIISLLPKTWHLVLDFRILLILLFKVISGIGFVAMGIGAIKLKRIEEV